MKTILLTLAVICFFVTAKAQAAATPKATPGDTTIYVTIDHEPEFPGGLNQFYTFLSKNIHYPAVSRQKKTRGTVFVQFVVEGDGSLTNLKLISGVSKEIDNEAFRVLAMCPKWQPGLQDGKPVRCSYTVPIKFAINK